MSMIWMNYNQFYYFWVIAKEMSVTRAAKRLRLSQSNLSGQLRTFEDTIGQKLFERRKRALYLTESGKLALEYAETIFPSADELMNIFKNKPVEEAKKTIRVGSVNNLSKNLQYEFIKPLLEKNDIQLYMAEDTQNEIVRMLQSHQLDVIVTNSPVRGELSPQVFSHKLGEIDVYFVGSKKYKNKLNSEFPQSLSQIPMLLPVKGTRIREEFDSWCSLNSVNVNVRAEIDDMALIRIFALEEKGVAVVPEIVVRRELESGELIAFKKLTGIRESFYAVTATRRFPNQQIQRLVQMFSSTQNRKW